MTSSAFGQVCKSDGANRRGPKEHCATGPAGEHGLPEADHRSSRRTRRRHIVVRVHSFAIDTRLMYTEHFAARIFLMRAVCQVVLSRSHPSYLAQGSR